MIPTQRIREIVIDVFAIMGWDARRKEKTSCAQLLYSPSPTGLPHCSLYLSVDEYFAFRNHRVVPVFVKKQLVIYYFCKRNVTSSK